MRLHQVRMRGDDADAETVGAAFRCGNAPLVNVRAVAVCLPLLIQNGDGRIAHVAVVRFAVIGFDSHMSRVDCAEMHPRADLQ